MLTGFKLRSEITKIRVIAVGRSIRELPDGTVWNAELHWYEAHGIGRRGMKIKKLLS